MKKIPRQPASENYYLELARKEMLRELDPDGLNKWLVINQQDQEHKLSAALIELIRPWLEQADSLPAMEKLTAIGALAWNASLSEGKTARDKARPILKSLALEIEDKLFLRNLLLQMIERKERLFPDDDRLIAGQKVYDTGQGWHLNVLAAPIAATEPLADAVPAAQETESTHDQSLHRP